MRFRFGSVWFSSGLLLVSAACWSLGDEGSGTSKGDKVTLKEVKNELELELEQLPLDIEAGRDTELFQLTLTFPEHEAFGSGCYAVHAQASLNGVTMKQTDPGRSHQSSGCDGELHPSCSNPTFRVPVDAVKNRESLTLEVWDDTHRIRARYQPPVQPSVTWINPPDGVVCAGELVQARLTPAPHEDDLTTYGWEAFDVSYIYQSEDGLSVEGGTAWLENRSGDVITVAIDGPAPSQGELEIRLSEWTVLCEGARHCGTAPERREEYASLSVTVVDCPGPWGLPRDR